MSDVCYRVYKFKLLLNNGQYEAMSEICEAQRQLYNAALEERIGCYNKTGKPRTFIDQCKALTVLRQDKEFSQVPVKLQRWTLKRLDDAFKAFYSRAQQGHKPGFPRYKSKSRWKSFGFAEKAGFKFDGKRISFNGLPGSIRVNQHRKIKGVIKSCSFLRNGRAWYVLFACELPFEKQEAIGAEIGIDVGITNFATLSNGETIENPRIGQHYQKEIRRRQRALARCVRGSRRRKKVKARLTRIHLKVSNTRRTFLHQQSSKLAKQFSRIAVEDLVISNMKKSNLARSINDVAWGTFIEMLTYKAESAGGEVIKVNPRNTSQLCSGCGEIVKKSLKERTHSCPCCGLVLDRDHNAALNILSRGVVVPFVPKVAGYGELAQENTDFREATNVT